MNILLNIKVKIPMLIEWLYKSCQLWWRVYNPRIAFITLSTSCELFRKHVSLVSVLKATPNRMPLKLGVRLRKGGVYWLSPVNLWTWQYLNRSDNNSLLQCFIQSYRASNSAIARWPHWSGLLMQHMAELTLGPPQKRIFGAFYTSSPKNSPPPRHMELFWLGSQLPKHFCSKWLGVKTQTREGLQEKVSSVILHNYLQCSAQEVRLFIFFRFHYCHDCHNIIQMHGYVPSYI